MVNKHPEVQAELMSRYDGWLTEMRRINPMDLPLFVGTDHEQETVLTNQDAKEVDAKTRTSEWRLKVVESGTYRIGFSDKTFNGPVTVDLSVDNQLVATQSVRGM